MKRVQTISWEVYLRLPSEIHRQVAMQCFIKTGRWEMVARPTGEATAASLEEEARKDEHGTMGSASDRESNHG